MHKLMAWQNPGLAVGNPVHYHFSLCENIEADRRHHHYCQIDSTLDLDEFMSQLGQSTPTRDNPDQTQPSSSNDPASSDVLVTPPNNSPFVSQPRTNGPYDWLYVDPELDM